VETLLRTARGKEFQIVGAASAKLREPKQSMCRCEEQKSQMNAKYEMECNLPAMNGSKQVG